MTVTYSSGTITITSTNFSNFGIIDTATLTSKINCCDTEYSVEIESGDVTGNNYQITNTDFYGQSTLDDGIYSFRLVIEYNNGSTTTEELGCLFVDEETGCLVAECVSGNVDVNTPEGKEVLLLEMDYFYLKNATNGCPCECDKFCSILERVWKKVGKIDCDICNTAECPDC